MGEFEERVWWTADNPRHMLRMSRLRPNGRKYLLLACAIVRHVIPGQRTSLGLRVLDELERFAFAQPAKGVRTDVWHEIVRPRVLDVPSVPVVERNRFLDDAFWASAFAERFRSLNTIGVADLNVVLARSRVLVAPLGEHLADLVREVFANPRRPPVIEPGWLACNHCAARHIADGIAASGNFADLPIMADALEDAGCRDEDLLRHCREAHTHVPGCWALDAVLGRG